MSMHGSRAAYAVCVIATLLIANAVQAQSTTATPGKTPQTTTALPADEADALFTHWDTDHNGALSPAEFRAGWHQLQATAELRRLHEQFVAMDTDKNNCLNAAEYAHLTLIKNAGASAPPMSMFDTEKNQCLDFKEYVNVVDYMLKHEQK
ncbi:MAG: EF-hand domain-containing protein [Rhodanobacter sp.]